MEDIAVLEQRMVLLEKGIRAMNDSLDQLIRYVVREEKHYSLPEAAKRLGFSVRTLYRKIDAGLITPAEDGGRVFITEKECKRYLSANRSPR